MAVDFTFARNPANLSNIVHPHHEHYRSGALDDIEEDAQTPDNAGSSMSPPTATFATAASGVIEGVFGISKDTLSRLSVQSSRDELELMEAAQQEYLFRAGPKRKKKPRQALEALDQKIADVGSGPEGDYIALLARLIEKYKIAMPAITIEYRNLDVSTQALKGSDAVPTVGSSFLDLARMLLFLKRPTIHHKILDNVSGVLAPARTTLVLGPPSSGKSSFLKTLSGRMTGSSTVKMKTDVRYNGHTFDEFNVIRTSAFVGQVDTHIPALTVLETLEFAHTCQVGHTAEFFSIVDAIESEASKAGVHRNSFAAGDRSCPPTHRDESRFMQLLSEVKEARGIRVMSVMRVLGIAHTKDTPVGDSMLRGVSGGERKRVTLAEMLVGGKTVFCLDEISTGLDSATLYSIIHRLGRLTKSFKLTTVISLLQPPPEVYNLFDDLILMSQGHIVWHGPVGDVVAFFSSLGFVCPPRKDVPSFLQEVVTETGQLEYASEELLKSKGFLERRFPTGRKSFLVPPAEIAAAYWACPTGQKMKAKLDTPFNKDNSHPTALKHGQYALTPLEALSVVTKMQMLLVMKDFGLVRGRLIQTLVIGLLVGGLFYQLDTDPSSASLFFGAAFLMIMFVSMGAMVGLTTALAAKPVWFKHRANMFYPAWALSLCTGLVQIPVQCADVAVWCMLTYFMIGFYYGAGYWFTNYVILLGVSVCFGCVFRCIAHLAPDGISANSLGGLILLVLIVMSGFTIPKPDIPDWWIWAYWLSPYAWAMRSLVINEMTSPSWDALDSKSLSPEPPTVGETSLASFGFYSERYWIWAGVGYLFGASLVVLWISSLALAYLSGPTKIAAVSDEEELEAARIEAVKRREAMATSRDQQREKEMKKLDKDVEMGVRNVTGEAGEETAQGSIPFQKITLVWRDLRYFVPNPSYNSKTKDDTPEKLELLKGITGYAEPGQLTALMGGSGAGKTTLMDCVAGRKTIGEITGDISVNGHPKVQATWSRVMGYVEQMDIHTPAQTIVEALMFSARLRLPSDTSQDKIRAYVDEVMELVDLTEIMFSMVGYPGESGLSVEQRKRLTIANEMVSNPSVMFMDEPTSGLDARAASIVMRTVRNVGNSQRAVVVTIHQPSIEIFEAFDNLLLLQRGGRITYFGPLGHESRKLVDYLQAVPGCVKMKEGFNPATWMLEVTGGAIAVTAKAVDVNWPDLYSSSQLCASNHAYADQLVARDREVKKPLEVSGVYAVSFGMQCSALFRKFWAAYWRMPSYNYIRYVMTIVVACIYGSIYYKAADFGSSVSMTTVQSVGGVVYLSVSFLGMSNMMSVMPLVGLERVVYYREQAASYYNPWGYGLILNVVEMPYQFVQVCFFVCILYPMLFFIRSAAHFFFYLAMTLLSLMFYVSFGMALMYVSPSQQLAMISGSGLNFLFNIFNGYVIPYPAMARGFQWINRISPTSWVIYGLVSDQLGDIQLPVTGVPNTPIGSEPTCAEYVNQKYGYEYGFRGWTLLIILAYIVFLRVAAILALRYINFLRR